MGELKLSEVLALVCEAKFAAETLQLYIADHDICLAGDAVGDDRPFYLGNYGLHVWLIQAKDRCAVKRHAVNELREGALNVFERGVLIEMLAVNGGHHRDDRRK